MTKTSSKLTTKTLICPVASSERISDFETQLYRLLDGCVISLDELRKIGQHTERLVQNDVISLDEAREVETLVLEGKVSATTAIHHLSWIESVRSATHCERSRHGMVYVFGDQVTGSGRVCRTLRV